MQQKEGGKMQTERLTLRPVAADDWESIRQIRMDFARSPYVMYDTQKSVEPEEVKKQVARWADETRAGAAHLVFVCCRAGTVIGFVSLRTEEEGFEIGYGFLAPFHGKGYAQEGLLAVLRYAKARGAKRVSAGTALKNLPSVRLLRRGGFVLTEMKPLSFFRDAAENDMVFESGHFVKMR